MMKRIVKQATAKHRIFVMLIAASALACADTPEPILRIYLPREKIMTEDTLTLGTIAILRGEQSTVQLAQKLGLGRFAVNGQQIVIERQTIKSRLASSGIDPALVEITGAEKVLLRRDEKTIAAGRIIEVATEFMRRLLAENFPNHPDGEVIVIKEPRDILLPHSGGEIRLLARENTYSRQTKRRIWVGVFVDGQEVDGREVIFSIHFKVKRLVASIDIPQGMMIGPGNSEIETIESPTPQEHGWQPPYGLVSSKYITKGRVIDRSCAGPAQAPMVIERRQTVMIKIQTPVLYVTSSGVSMEQGRVGDFIRVRSDNGNGRVIVGKVLPDGSVSPTF